MPHHQVWKQKGEEYRLFGGGGWVWTSGLQCRKRKRPTGDLKDTAFVNKKRKLLDTTNRISALKAKKRKEELKKEADKVAKIAAAQQALPQNATTPVLTGQSTSTTMPTTAVAVQSSSSVQNAVSSTPSLSQNSVQTTTRLNLASSTQITSSATTASTSCSITSTTPLTVASLVPQPLSATCASAQSCVNPAVPASQQVSTRSSSVISVSATSQTASSTVPTSLSSVECPSTTSLSLTVASSSKSVATVSSIQTIPTKTSSDNLIQSSVRIVSSTSSSTSFLNSAATLSPSVKGCSLNATFDKGSSSLDVNRSNSSITFSPEPLTTQESVSSSEVVSSGAVESREPSTPIQTVSTLALAKDSVVALDSSPVTLQDTSSESISVFERPERSETSDNLLSVSISNGQSNADKDMVDCPTVKFPSGVSTEDTTQMESTYDRALIYSSEQNADKEKLEFNNDLSVDCSTLESSCGVSNAQNAQQVEAITENTGNKESVQNQLNVDNLTSQNDRSTSFVFKGSEGNDKPNLTSDSLDTACLEDATITDSNVKQSTSPFDSCTRQERLVKAKRSPNVCNESVIDADCTVDFTQDTKVKKDELSESQQGISEFVNVQCDNNVDKHDGEVTSDKSSSLQVEGDGYEVLEESGQAVDQENQNPSLSVENEMQGIALTKPDSLGGHKDLNNSPCSSDTDANEREKEIKPVDQVLVSDRESELCPGRISNNVLSDDDVLDESQSKRTSLNDSLIEEVSETSLETERAENLPDASASAKGKQCLGIVDKDVIAVANHDMPADISKSSLEDLCNHDEKDDFSDEKSAIASSCSKVKDRADVSSSPELARAKEAHRPLNNFEAEQSTAGVSCGGATDTQTMKAKGGDNGQVGALFESSNRDVGTECSSGEDGAVQGSRSDDSFTASISTVSTSHLGETHNEQETPVDVDVTTVSPSRPTSEIHVCSSTDAHVSPEVDSSVTLSTTFADSEPLHIQEAEPMDIDDKAVSKSESSCSETPPRMSKNSGDDCSSLPTEDTSIDTTTNREAVSLGMKNSTSFSENSTTSFISVPKTSTTVSSRVNAVSTCDVTTAKSVMSKSTCTTPTASSTPAMPVPASQLSVSLPSVLVQCATSIDNPTALSTAATTTFTETAAINIKPLLSSVTLQSTGVVSTSPRNVVAVATPLAFSAQSTAVKSLVVNKPTGSASTRITTAQKTAVSSRVQTAQYVPIGPKPILPSPRLTGQSIVLKGTNVVQPTVVGQASTAPVNSMAALVARIPGSGATIGPSQLIRLVTADGKSITLQGSQLAAIAQQMGSPMQLAVPKTITVQVSGATVQQNPVKTVGASTTATTITVPQRPQQQPAHVKPQIVIKPIKEEKFPSLEPLIKDPRALLNRRIAKWPLRHSVKSLFTLEKHERRKLGRKAGMKEVNGYVYTSRAVGVNWPVGIPRPSFKVAWRFRTQSLKTLAGAAIQLRILQSCLKWDEMNVRPPRGNNNTVYTSSG